MPQAGTHIVIAKRTAAAIADPKLDAQIKALQLGAIGPDLMLFLFDPAGRWPVFDATIDVLLAIRDIEALLEDVESKALGPAADFADWITGGLSTQLNSLIGTAMGALQNAMIMQLLPATNAVINNPFAGLGIPGVPNHPTITLNATPLAHVFRAFGHPYTHDPPFKRRTAAPDDYDQWWWIDLLHYRRTGAFAQSLLKKAGHDPLLKAYATGYLTHVAGDICGHPYVNTVVGGPFRNHVVRHMTVEKVVDAWIWNHFENEDLSRSRLHEHVDIGGDFGAVAQLLRECMDEVYIAQAPSLAPQHFPGSLPSERNLHRAYAVLLQYLELSTTAKHNPPVPPPGSPAELFAEIGASLGGTASNIAEAFNPSNEWWEWLLAPFIAALYGLLLLFKLATLPVAVVVRAIAVAPRWFAYFIENALYQFIQNARWTLAISGWGMPSSSDLARPFAQLCVHLPPQRTGSGAFDFPFAQPLRSTPAFWLADPQELGAVLELGSARAGGVESCPYPKAATPDVFVDGPGYDTGRDQLLHRFSDPQPMNANTTRGIEQETFSGSQFGNAVEFAQRILKGKYPLASFDLDADPGYGFLGWEGPPPTYGRHL